MKVENIIECHHCGLFLKKREYTESKKFLCPRCNSKLGSSKKHDLEALYYAISSLLLFVILNFYPLISLSMAGFKLEAKLYNSFFILLSENFFLVALVVFFTIFLAPVLNSCIIILSFIQSNTRINIFTETLLHDSFHFFKTWSFIEVFIIGVIVSYIKLVGMVSSTYFDIGFYIMIAYLFCFYMSNVKFEDKNIFEV